MPLETLVALGQAEGLVCCGTFAAVVLLIGWVATTAFADRRREREAERQKVADANGKARARKVNELAESQFRRCPHNDCQHENKPGARFCGQCGRFMDDSPNA